MTDTTLLQEHARPTSGVRILEFEHELKNKSNIDVELWDTSGDLGQGRSHDEKSNILGQNSRPRFLGQNFFVSQDFGQKLCRPMFYRTKLLSGKIL